jgi:lysophospholipase L1-like esterase
MKRVIAIVVLIAAVALIADPLAAATPDRRKRNPGPLRVLLVGDSITRDYTQVAIPQLQAKGYQVIYAGVPGRSLLDANQCTGIGANRYLGLFDPDVVVMQYTGNYGLLTAAEIHPCQPLVELATKPFFKQWKRAAKINQKILTKRKARFFWILNPVVHPAYDPTRTLVPGINNIYRKVAGRRAGVIDAWTAFGGSVLFASLHTDGLHLSDSGKQRMANLVVRAVG